MKRTRRDFLGDLAKLSLATAGSLLASSIQRAYAIPARFRDGTIRDVEHIVILTQENRSFDHYFGTFGGVRGFADPFPIPVPESLGIQNKSVWYQPSDGLEERQACLVPFALNTTQNFAHMRVEGTPHSWSNAQRAWDHGKMHRWPIAKRNHSLGYYAKADIPFQWDLANAFTLCDAYHCSIQAGTNPNRLFIWSGSNDPLARANGPATYNEYDNVDADPGNNGGYNWITYAERLERAGVSWQVYQNMADNFTDNPLVGFRNFRDAWFQRPGHSPALRHRGVGTRDLDMLSEDVAADRLPAVSWIVATAEGSEHPATSSPAQGAAYTARVLDALTANPAVWSKTILLINFDENDGFFDHVPPPAPPSYVSWHAEAKRAVLAGASTVDTRGEYHEHFVSYRNSAEERAFKHHSYGLGARVPLYAISPWSKGGWVNSQVFDHTSIIRLLERRFGVSEPNISPWRRAVCGDLTSAFNFAKPDDGSYKLLETQLQARRARALPGRTTPPTPADITLPVQEALIRPSRALPYELHVSSRVMPDSRIELTFANTGAAAAVFHVYDRLHLEDLPRRYTVESGKALVGSWQAPHPGDYDLWVLAPNGFHRHFCGRTPQLADFSEGVLDVQIDYNKVQVGLVVRLTNRGLQPALFSMVANRYDRATPSTRAVSALDSIAVALPLYNNPWYDFSVKVEGQPSFMRRFAGRVETGADSMTDPEMGGEALVEQYRFDPNFA